MNNEKQQLMAEVLLLGARCALSVKAYDEAHALIKATDRLWPDYPDLVDVKATLLYMRYQTGEALAILHGRNDTRSLAIKAACFLRLNIADWYELLQEILERDDDESARIFAITMFKINGIPVLETTANADETTSDKFSLFTGIRA